MVKDVGFFDLFPFLLAFFLIQTFVGVENSKENG
jgi:hypothetical protein